MPNHEVDELKNAARRRIWDLLDREGLVVGGSAHGHIPDFVGADAAAVRLSDLPAWKAARAIKAVPDKAQLPARARALREGKTVYMAVPKLAQQHPFYLLDPAGLAVPPEEAASSRTAATVARNVGLDEVEPIDLIVCGSVAVNRHGARLGKGAGYSDIEVALLHESGLIGPETPIVTTVHSLQVVDDELPETEHDFRVDLIVTPDEVIPCGPPKRPTGLIWEHLSPDKIAAIPVLAARAPK
ncbi:5-formyltetrahydrofolate cyclo-ligase [Saccharomonospora amisosensis]|uniref:5-formyltetrahydrofolate cyclo-ligase n=1 Tax=Saccharomonospora amisosensis TaxID=1128677 RepID=A0A7X5ULZ2_9PSEU|nr:5-formyltetrahydrofolate cyclo-ligase [Saccharomonospora amisosensis]NIJ10473.1 5-formyltetrahydrofolate cyclo-ligase [Saccharomonospora amisosensis]